MLSELYQEVILDHNHNPRNHYVMEDHDTTAAGHNRLCGDKLTVYIKYAADQIEAVSFVGCGCAISTASASLMTQSIRGKTIETVKQLFHDFHQALTTSTTEPLPSLGKLSALLGVKQFPARVKCATLAWHTLQAAIEKNEICVSTEIV